MAAGRAARVVVSPRPPASSTSTSSSLRNNRNSKKFSSSPSSSVPPSLFRASKTYTGRKEMASGGRDAAGGAGDVRAAATAAASDASGSKGVEAADVVNISFDALVAAADRRGEWGASAEKIAEAGAGEASALRKAIAEAYGADGLGILTVDGVPGVEELRARLLPLASRLASLDGAALARLEDPESSYSVGWSHGKEILEGGVPDTLKGSFYANPLVNRPTEDEALMREHPSYCRPNLWPSAEIPELEKALMDLGSLVVRVGELVGVLCDDYLADRGVVGARSLSTIIRESKATKARLLHYFPPPEAAATGDAGGEDDMAKWCGWHLDHGSLTGLVSGMFMHGDQQVASPDRTAGLYIRDRSGTTRKVSFLPTQLAFQIGQASQVHSGGELVATPHCVKGASDAAAAGIARNSFAIFMQPRWDEPMDLPDGVTGSDVAQWQEGLNFGEFTTRTISNYY